MRLYASALVVAALAAGLCSAGSAVASAAAPGETGTTSATALTLSAQSVAYGTEQDEQLTVTVSGAGGTPTGTVTISAGPATVCTITLLDGTGECAPTADEFTVGPVTLTASYGGDDTFAASSSPAINLQVTGPPPAAPTTTALKLSKAALTYWDEQAEQVSVLVGSPDAIPVGSVTIRSGGTTLCTFNLSGFGDGSCTLKAAALPPGTARLTASYSGSTITGYAPSVSAAKPVAVAKEPTTTAVALSATKVTYGAEQRERITVAVRPAFGGTPTGRVTVKAGKTTIRVITLTSGRGAYTLAAGALAGGAVRLTASYAGDNRYARSASGAKSLAVARATSKTTLGLSAATVTYGREGSEKISVRVAPRSTGTPGGTVTVRANGATLAVIRLKSGVGSYPLSASRLRAGDYSLVATYSGNGDFGPSVSAKRSLTVASPPPPPGPATCHPHTSTGKCYKAGEFCPAADHWLTGVAGNGEAIVCEDNDGWRWEPVS